jgi:hypothetical protein
MKVSAGWSASYEFACHSAACRPPSSGGTGGSIGSRKATTPAGRGRSKDRRNAEEDRVASNKLYEQMKAREAMQQRLAHTNKYRVAQGMNPLTA